ncbi:MAG TPA: hypothetical protein VNQ99_06270 [Xanthobacteraceae bacterium]|nr:hypothetical protein [Xanthobacteraceae bacterium]
MSVKLKVGDRIPRPAGVPDGYVLVPREPTTLLDCPVGLFINQYGGLCLKTEYGNNEGRIDAYIVSSGEFFWGEQPQTIANQRKQIVTPVDALTAAPPPPAQGWQPIETAPKDRTDLIFWVEDKVRFCGGWRNEQYAKNPRPYWTYATSMGVQYVRESQPTLWQLPPTPPAVEGE